ncbi:hypothetical protein BK008_04955 [Methanobacterium sp. MZ-A1]|uniref:Uncharacterized protein n=1 Tax=Methanobacterium subterraneum TaxID=59277 RepID=A0A2H4VB39_9EURY|nr:hypothetical protein BK007_04225 [Methanobacterium subterraneum]AUB57724.1 hypothetical protein BK008_04955 [Methanobacterium sp. MZ-A1]
MKEYLIKILFMRQGSIEIVSSIIYLFLTLLFFENPTFPFIMPVTFIFLFGIVTGLLNFVNIKIKCFIQ